MKLLGLVLAGKLNRKEHIEELTECKKIINMTRRSKNDTVNNQLESTYKHV